MQSTILGFISLHNVLRLYIENRKLAGKNVLSEYLQLYSIIKQTIAISTGYRCQQTIEEKTFTCCIGPYQLHDKSHFDYFFVNIQSINDFKTEYFFVKISKAGDLRVK